MHSGDTKLISGRVHQSMLVSCRSGVVWVTAAGDPQDYIVEAGKELTIKAGHENVLLESLSENLELDICLNA